LPKIVRRKNPRLKIGAKKGQNPTSMCATLIKSRIPHGGNHPRKHPSSILVSPGQFPAADQIEEYYKYIYIILYILNIIFFLKFPKCERSEPLFPLNFVLNFAVLFNFLTPSSIYSSFFPSSGVLGTFFGGFSPRRRFVAGFGGFLADSFVDFSVRFLVPFLSTILPPF
jgi:hypothetical protein